MIPSVDELGYRYPKQDIHVTVSILDGSTWLNADNQFCYKVELSLRRALMHGISINTADLNTLIPEVPIQSHITDSRLPDEDALLVLYKKNNVNGAKIIENSGGSTLFHWVVALGFLHITKFFIEQGMDVNVVDSTSISPMHLSVFNGDFELTSLLLQHGAKLDTLDCNGRTPFDLAVKYGDLDTIRLFQNHSGRCLMTPLPLQKLDFYKFLSFLKYFEGKLMSWRMEMVPFLPPTLQILCVISHKFLEVDDHLITSQWLCYDDEGFVTVRICSDIFSFFLNYLYHDESLNGNDDGTYDKQIQKQFRSVSHPSSNIRKEKPKLTKQGKKHNILAPKLMNTKAKRLKLMVKKDRVSALANNNLKYSLLDTQSDHALCESIPFWPPASKRSFLIKQNRRFNLGNIKSKVLTSYSFSYSEAEETYTDTSDSCEVHTC
eukprot:TRINITY_DN10309_c0_g2_i2.p1 TRINITY_DN10309_c0_g2~~TRINITY_DN10309_c0_g2_i2.p1  ORF type:complete len:434 (+),score=41.13 TRINITY_DN10309_c0_g2_i2:542-1843(+)